MIRSNFTIALVITTGMIVLQAAACSQAEPDKISQKQCEISKTDSNSLNQIFTEMDRVANKLKTCQAEIAFTTIQDPELLNTRILRTGTLYYKKNENNRDQLRIHFRDIKQDDFDPEQEREEYLFDGVWLKRINFKLKQIDMYQKAPKDKPIAVFELIENNFPIVGFSGSKGLQAEFKITQTNTDPNEPISLLLIPKKDSKFSKDYKKIKFRIDKKSYLPAEIVSYSTQGDIYHVVFSDIKVNKKLENAVFTVETPDSFIENREYLNDSKNEKGS